MSDHPKAQKKEAVIQATRRLFEKISVEESTFRPNIPQSAKKLCETRREFCSWNNKTPVYLACASFSNKWWDRACNSSEWSRNFSKKITLRPTFAGEKSLWNQYNKDSIDKGSKMQTNNWRVACFTSWEKGNHNNASHFTSKVIVNGNLKELLYRNNLEILNTKASHLGLVVNIDQFTKSPAEFKTILRKTPPDSFPFASLPDMARDLLCNPTLEPESTLTWLKYLKFSLMYLQCSSSAVIHKSPVQYQAKTEHFSKISPCIAVQEWMRGSCKWKKSLEPLTELTKTQLDSLPACWWCEGGNTVR